MNRIETGIDGLFVLEPTVFTDDRGHFFEAYSRERFQELGILDEQVQVNQSFSQAGVLRGLHFQAPPAGQSKLVRAVAGRIFDVAVDLRRGSPTFGRWYGVELSDENHRMLYIPKGFAHGFYAITACRMVYHCGHAGYQKDAEGGLRYDDPDVGIVWPFDGSPLVNERDASYPTLRDLRSPFHSDDGV